MSITKLARPEIVAMKPYSSARKEAPAEGVLLNANESPWSLFGPSDQATSYINRYPEPQPKTLLESLARLYELPQDHLLITRGSDEGIDLLTRVFCRAGKDAILHCPPTFGMYRIAAEIQGASVVSIARSDNDDFAIDQQSVLDAIREDDRIRLVFMTSPNNPTGDLIDADFLNALLEETRNRAIVVIDEAYAEFCEQASAIDLISDNPHLVVLRTLSKAWAAAGLRCGTVLAQPEVINLLLRVIAPYPLAEPVTRLAERVMQTDMALRQKKLLAELKSNKDLLLSILKERPFVRKIWPGEANFILLRVDDAPALLNHCAQNHVILRGYPSDPSLQDCIRISVGSKQDIATLDEVLNRWEANNP
jgi:histidinol-phosphate aminotransferase